MKCVDSSFLIDLLRGAPAASAKAEELQRVQASLLVPAPCVTEILRGAHLVGGTPLQRTEELIEQLELLPFDASIAKEAGTLSAGLTRRGTPIGFADLIVAATAIHHRAVLVTRDADFVRVPNLTVETY